MIQYIRPSNKDERIAMQDEKTKSVKDSIVEAFEEQSIGKPDMPTLPLVGSENVPVTAKEEQYVES